MTAFTQQFLTPGRYHVAAGKIRDLSRDVLSRFQRGTNALLKAGGQIPIILAHAAPGSREGSPRDSRADVVRHGVGWLNGITQNSDGSLSHSFEVTDPDVAKKVRDGSIKYTSPEFRDVHVHGGHSYRDVFAHFALTPRPRNTDQGTFREIAVEQFSCDDGPYQFSLSDRETIQMADDDKKTFPPGSGNDDSHTDESDQQAEAPSDMPATSGDSQAQMAMTALIAHLEEMGLKLTQMTQSKATEGDLSGFVDGVLQALVAAKSAREKVAEESATPSDDDDENEDAPDASNLKENVPPGTQQFSEAETMANAKLKDIAKTAVTTQATATLDGLIKQGRIGKGMHDAMTSRLSAVQFSDDGEEEATMKVTDVVAMLDEGTTDNQALTGEGTEEHEHPSGEAWLRKDAKGQVSDEDAVKEADDIFARNRGKRRQTVGA